MTRRLFFYLMLGSGLTAWLACSDLERTNPLDPQNPKSFSTQVVLAELFVNDNVTYDTTGAIYPYSAYAEAALESLAIDFSSSRLLYAQYHIGEQHHDSLDLPANDDYYKQYVAANGDLKYAVPDVFINGPAIRVQGASDQDAAYARMRAAIANVLDQRCFFTIEGSMAVDSAAISVSARIARLGNSDSPDSLKAQYIVVRDMGQDNHHLVVCYTPAVVNLPVIDQSDIYQVPTQTIANTKKLPSDSVVVIVCIKNEQQAVLQTKLITGAQ
jgi:hypothetical protein